MGIDVATIGLYVLPILLAVVCHEWAHGYVAYRLGDDTAARLGRLTLNPIAHIDPIGTILMPGFLLLTGSPFLFGYAKPVPISWHRLRNPARDMVWVAAAGPLMNLTLAVASTLLLRLVLESSGPASFSGADDSEGGGFSVATPLAVMCQASIGINLVLAVFNLLPIPPLDGGRVAVGLLPRSLGYPLARIEPFGFFIVFGLLMTGMLSSVVGPLVHGLFLMLRQLL